MFLGLTNSLSETRLSVSYLDMTTIFQLYSSLQIKSIVIVN